MQLCVQYGEVSQWFGYASWLSAARSTCRDRQGQPALGNERSVGSRFDPRAVLRAVPGLSASCEYGALHFRACRGPLHRLHGTQCKARVDGGLGPLFDAGWPAGKAGLSRAASSPSNGLRFSQIDSN